MRLVADAWPFRIDIDRVTGASTPAPEELPRGKLEAGCFHPHADVAAVRRRGEYCLREVRRGPPVFTFADGYPAAWSPDGELLAVTRADGGEARVEVWRCGA